MINMAPLALEKVKHVLECSMASFQARRQDLAAGGPKTRRRGQKPIEGLALFVPAWHIFLPTATWDTLFIRRE